ncbi:MAG: molybdopterin molybdotransferase MoeA [Sphingomonadaceae bacterium]|nr:molybdopterin molybdotransferase MoeA [Sphingomonadaceae bacterium]
MISFDEALAIVDARVAPLGSEQVALGDAAGRYLSEPLIARSDAPRHAISAMDGYAVDYASVRAGDALRIIGTSTAGGDASLCLGPGQAARIFTGAPLPEGADGVIMQEYADVAGDVVRFAGGFGPARHVRAAGSDFRAGDILLAAGQRLSPRAMCIAAAADVAQLAVASTPHVAILATGDELAAPGSAYLHPHRIPESVSFGVAAQLAAMGGKVAWRGACGDDLARLTAAAGDALAAADLVVVTGGASVGDRDFAKPMFAAHGLELLWEKIAIKPGKPVWLGVAAGRYVLGLPGNPTSAMVTGHLVLRALLARMQGASAQQFHRWMRLPLAAPIGATGNRETFVRASWQPDGLAPISMQDSGAQAALAQADWLIRCPAGQAAQTAGEMVSALPF